MQVRNAAGDTWSKSRNGTMAGLVPIPYKISTKYSKKSFFRTTQISFTFCAFTVCRYYWITFNQKRHVSVSQTYLHTVRSQKIRNFIYLHYWRQRVRYDSAVSAIWCIFNILAQAHWSGRQIFLIGIACCPFNVSINLRFRDYWQVEWDWENY